MSIKRFLSLALGALILVASGVVILATYVSTKHEVDELFDAQLVQQTNVIALLSAGQTLPLAARDINTIEGHNRYQRYATIQQWNANGELLLSSDTTSTEPLSEFREGLTVQKIRGGTWHVMTKKLANSGWLMVAENGRSRDELRRGAAVAVVMPFIFAVPFILLLVTWVIGRGLRPLVELHHAVNARDSGNLQPLQTGAGEVVELAPLEAAINHLLEQLGEAFAREQRFTADAAHELRTLLAVLKLHADNAQSLPDPEDVRASLQQLQGGVDRATRMVAQLLMLARIDPQSRADVHASTEATPVAERVLAELQPLAQQRQQTLELNVMDKPVTVGLTGDLLHMLLRNVVENGLRYSGPGTNVQIQIGRTDHGTLAPAVSIRVIDQGEGVSPEIASRVTERFYRGSQEGLGVGLGLSIVSRIIQTVGGVLRFHAASAQRPAEVEIILPRG